MSRPNAGSPVSDGLPHHPFTSGDWISVSIPSPSLSPRHRTPVLYRVLAVLFLVAAAVPFTTGSAQAQAPVRTVYVSPVKGSATGNGSAAHPFKTLVQARYFVRKINQHMQSDIHID